VVESAQATQDHRSIDARQMISMITSEGKQTSLQGWMSLAASDLLEHS
jgi:hypothetical protein